jgi:Icc protein
LIREETSMTAPDHVIVQLSDPHFVAHGLLHGRVDPAARLTAALDAIAASDCRPDVLLLSGDLADAGHPEAYRALRGVVEPAAARLGAEVVYLPGNHDDVAELERGLFDREPDGRPLDQVIWAGGLRLVGLDSTRATGPDGELTDRQLAWLRDVLAEPAPEGTVLAVHHPPILSPIPMINRITLNDPHRLAAAIEGTDVRMVLCGHSHHVSAGTLGAVPVWVAPATVYYSDVLAPVATFRGITGGGFTRVDITDGAPVATFVPIGEPAAPLYEIDVAQILDHIAGRAGADA